MSNLRVCVCLCACVDHPLIECPKGRMCRALCLNVRQGKQTQKIGLFLVAHILHLESMNRFIISASRQTQTPTAQAHKHSGFRASVPEERPLLMTYSRYSTDQHLKKKKCISTHTVLAS